jgi:hypothetical protein
MQFLTDRKRAVGLGSAKTGTEHFWAMKVSSVALLLLIPLFVLTFGPMLGQPHEAVLAHFGRPFPAIVAGADHRGRLHALQGRCAGADRGLCARHGAEGGDHPDDMPLLRRMPRPGFSPSRAWRFNLIWEAGHGCI